MQLRHFGPKAEFGEPELCLCSSCAVVPPRWNPPHAQAETPSEVPLRWLLSSYLPLKLQLMAMILFYLKSPILHRHGDRRQLPRQRHDSQCMRSTCSHRHERCTYSLLGEQASERHSVCGCCCCWLAHSTSTTLVGQCVDVSFRGCLPQHHPDRNKMRAWLVIDSLFARRSHQRKQAKWA